jgi:ABC-type antimicrobial peptide transport system permease subunit
VYLAGGESMTVVGVAGDVRITSIVNAPGPAMYIPSWLSMWPTMTVVLRTDGDPGSLAASLRAAVSRVDPSQPIFDVETMAAIVGRRIEEPRLNATLLSIFAGLALALAAVGVAGVTAYAVTRRTGELAVRQALGASPRQAMSVVLSSGLKVCAAGIVVGLAGALALGQMLSGLLYGVAPRDLPTVGATAAALAAVAAAACWLPARRATRISPTVALRE